MEKNNNSFNINNIQRKANSITNMMSSPDEGNSSSMSDALKSSSNSANKVTGGLKNIFSVLGPQKLKTLFFLKANVIKYIIVALLVIIILFVGISTIAGNFLLNSSTKSDQIAAEKDISSGREVFNNYVSYGGDIAASINYSDDIPNSEEYEVKDQYIKIAEIFRQMIDAAFENAQSKYKDSAMRERNSLGYLTGYALYEGEDIHGDSRNGYEDHRPEFTFVGSNLDDASQKLYVQIPRMIAAYNVSRLDIPPWEGYFWDIKSATFFKTLNNDLFKFGYTLRSQDIYYKIKDNDGIWHEYYWYTLYWIEANIDDASTEVLFDCFFKTAEGYIAHEDTGKTYEQYYGSKKTWQEVKDEDFYGSLLKYKSKTNSNALTSNIEDAKISSGFLGLGEKKYQAAYTKKKDPEKTIDSSIEQGNANDGYSYTVGDDLTLGGSASVGSVIQGGSGGSPTAIINTPKLSVRYFNQNDKRWGSKLYYPNGKISGHACGPTAMSIVVSTLLQKDITPEQMCAVARENNYHAPGYGSYHKIVPGIGNKFGLNVTGLGSDKNKIIQALRNPNAMVVVIVKKGTIATGGHFITLSDVSQDGQKALIIDPSGVKKVHNTWYNLDQIIKESNKGAASGGPFWMVSK